MLEAAGQLVAEERLNNVTLVNDDLFDSELEPSSFDLVHARFQLAPLGRVEEQMASYLRLVGPGGAVVLEDVDAGSWHYLPPAPVCDKLLALLVEAFRRAGGEPEAAARHLDLFGGVGITARVRAEVRALPPGHPYNRLLLQQAAGLDSLLRSFVDPAELDGLLAQVEREVADPGRWGLTFTLLQSWGRPAA